MSLTDYHNTLMLELVFVSRRSISVTSRRQYQFALPILIGLHLPTEES